MDFYHCRFGWLAAITLCLAFAQGHDLVSCDSHSSTSESDGVFETYTFEVKEGILLQPRKLVGTIPLSGNSSIGYKFEEPYFKKPNNFKTNALPAHFDVVFFNISWVQNGSTTHTPAKKRTIAPTTQFVASTSKPSRFTNDSFFTSYGSGMIWSKNSTEPGFNDLANNVTSSLVNATSLTLTTASDTEERSQCGGAQIFQTYSLDREEADKHYLAVINYEEDWGVPLLIEIKVTDINDNSPVFVEESLHTQITKNVNSGDIVAHVQATDADVGINAELQYSIDYSTERRGNASDSGGFMTFLIHKKLGIVTLFEDISGLETPTKITFKVIVKDRGDIHVSNRATASVTISIINSRSTWSPVTESSSTKAKTGGLIAGCVMGGVLLLGLITVAACKLRRRRVVQRDTQLEFMMDDDNLITA